MLRAICFSEMCNRKAKKTVKIGNTIGIEKTVRRDDWFCPDCKSALYWTRQNNNSVSRHQIEYDRSKPFKGDAWSW